MVNFLRAELVKPLYTAAHILDRWRFLYIPEACVSKMKTAALCVFALFLSSMLVGGSMGIPPGRSADYTGKNVHK